MKKIISYHQIILLTLLLYSGMLLSQNPEILYKENISSGFDNYGRSLAIAKDGGYVVLADQFLGGDTINFLVTKVNINGETDWQKSFGGSGHELASRIISTSDGGYLLTGYSNSSDGDVTENKGWDDCWLLKIDQGGNKQWDKSFGGSGRDIGYHAIEALDGGFYVAASTKSVDGDVSNNHGENDFWLIKTDNTGNMEWEKCYGGSDDEVLSDILQLNDTSILLFGSSRSADGDVSTNYGGKDYWLLAVNTSGNILWEKNYGGSDSDNGVAIDIIPGGGFALGGSSKSSDIDISKNRGLDDYWLVSCNTEGEIIWQRSYGGSNNDVMKQMRWMDGGFIMSGYSYSWDFDCEDNHGSSDMWVVKAFDNGQAKWTRSLGGFQADAGYDMVYTPDFGYLVAGYARSEDGDVEDPSGLMDTWVVKLCEDYDIHQHISICTGDSLLWEGEYYTETGSDERHFTSHCNRDSIRTLHLTIWEYPDNFEIVGDTVVVSTNSAWYTVPNNEGVEYSFFIENGLIHDFITDYQIVVAWGISGMGSVKAISTNGGGCSSDTSQLQVRISSSDVYEGSLDFATIYPNPVVNNTLSVKGKNLLKLELVNNSGNVLLSKDLNAPQNNITLNLPFLPKGIYHLKITAEKGITSRKIVIY